MIPHLVRTEVRASGDDGRVLSAAGLHLAAGLGLLRPEEQVFAAMVDGGRCSSWLGGLSVGTVAARQRFLNAQFEGAAAGEVFIAECKIWKVQDDPGCAYTTAELPLWRDTKAALLLFICSGEPISAVGYTLRPEGFEPRDLHHRTRHGRIVRTPLIGSPERHRWEEAASVSARRTPTDTPTDPGGSFLTLMWPRSGCES